MAADWFEKTPRIGSPEEFAALRALFAEAGYDEAGIRARPAADALELLIRLFVDGAYVEAERLTRVLPVLEKLDLLAGGVQKYATALIVPVGPLLTLCDRRVAPDGSSCELPPDVVYPATIANSREFQGILPAAPCDALLDLGTGTGIAALAGAAYARHAWGADIAARSVRFAEFGRRLNGIENASMVEGDLYEAVRGLTFDRIVAHPPYVPARRNTVIFRDAGEDGEQILRRIVEGLPEFLRPGGRFYTLVTAADCEGQPFEDRLRLWLGEAQDEFDLVLISHTLTAPKDLVANMLAKQNTPVDEVLYRQELWSRRKVEFLFYGTVLIRRHDGQTDAFTARVQKGEGYRPQHAEWLLGWHTQAVDTDALLASRPSVAPAAELAVIHRVCDGRLVPAAFSLRAPGPFDSECILQSWLAQVVTRCDGQRTWSELLEWARHAGLVDPHTGGAEFAGVLAALGGNGLLRIAAMPLESETRP